VALEIGLLTRETTRLGDWMTHWFLIWIVVISSCYDCLFLKVSCLLMIC
jgi:hypothetical protein